MNKLFLIVILFLSLVSCNSKNQEYTPRTYDFYMRGNLAGQHTSMLDSAGYYTYNYHFSDRGRGPEIQERIRLNDDGVISFLEISGVNYYKDSIAESFQIIDEIASWESSSEKGSKEVSNPAFYSSINSTLGDVELLIRRLLVAPDHKIDLLPEGTVKISSIEPIEVKGNDLRLVAVTGFGFTPSYTWLDRDDRIFARVSSWRSLVIQSHTELLDELLEIQTKRQNEYFFELAKEHTHIPDGKTIIENVNVFDAHSGNIIPDQSVVIEGNIITDIIEGDEEDATNYPNSIDGTDKTLLPGLFDNHSHIRRQQGVLHIAGGVTSIRDMASSMELLAIRDEFESNKSIGPRMVVLAGFIDQKGPYAGPGLTITNLEEGFEAIQNYSDSGFQQIKLYSSIDPEWVKPLAAKAHDLGLKLSGHIPSYMNAEQAVRDGFDEIQHVNMLVLNFLSDTIDTRTPLRFTEVADKAHMLDLESPAFQSFVTLLKSKEVEIDPTVSIFESMFSARVGQPNPIGDKIIHRFPLEVQRQFMGGGLPVPEGKDEIYKLSFQKLLDIIKSLYDNGVNILPGTDAMAGFALHKELENYVKAGIPANEVLRMATILSAQNARVEDRLGTIEIGKLADLILVDGNPAEDISDIRKVELTIKDGNMFYPKDLYEAYSIQHFK